MSLLGCVTHQPLCHQPLIDFTVRNQTPPAMGRLTCLHSSSIPSFGGPWTPAFVKISPGGTWIVRLSSLGAEVSETYDAAPAWRRVACAWLTAQCSSAQAPRLVTHTSASTAFVLGNLPSSTGGRSLLSSVLGPFADTVLPCLVPPGCAGSVFLSQGRSWCPTECVWR